MKITVNREEIMVPDSITVEKLREIRGLAPHGIAIAVNGRVVLAADQGKTMLHENDDVVIIGAAYGG